MLTIFHNFVLNKRFPEKLLRMKKIVPFVLFLALLATTVFSQSKTGAVVKFDKLVHDYGTIYQNDDGTCEFRFSNTGDEPLVLTSVRSSCGCTVPKWPKDPILPGQSANIGVSYDTKRLGNISKQITVVSNASESTIILSIKGTVIAKPSELMPEKQVNEGFTPTAN